MIKTPGLYDLINSIATIAVCLSVFVFFMIRREKSCALLNYGFEKAQPLRRKNGFLNVLFSEWTQITLTSILYVGVYAGLATFVDAVPFLSNNEYFTLNNYFTILYFGPVMVIGLQLVLGMDFRYGTDLLTPFFALEMGIGKIACFCAGCCYGIHWRGFGGAYNYTTGRTEFPVQLVELFVGILISIVLFFYLTKRKGKGRAYPLYMILYSASRFFTEFLRGDHEANWLAMKPYQVLCLIGVLIGAVWLIVIRILDKYDKRFLYGTNLFDYIREKRQK